jgi:predicted metal-dependent hydrolase
MQSIQFGKSNLFYSIRYSQKAQKKRIEITPYSIVVVAPDYTQENEIEEFIKENIKSVFVAQEKLRLKDKHIIEEADQYYSGGKISFRGRRLALKVEREDVIQPILQYKSKFYVTLPITSPKDNEETIIQSLIVDWLKVKLIEDSKELSRELGKDLGLAFKGIRVKKQKNLWATCGTDAVLHINLLLIRLPRKVLEYVIAHELAHLVCRNHSEQFWAIVEKMVPDYRIYQKSLDIIGMT